MSLRLEKVFRSKSDWAEYLNWAAESFRLSTSSVQNETQIHTHMCYSNFEDIVDTIEDLDADVITIEHSRSHMDFDYLETSVSERTWTWGIWAHP